VVCALVRPSFPKAEADTPAPERGEIKRDQDDHRGR
jgi:hypothetical protein